MEESNGIWVVIKHEGKWTHYECPAGPHAWVLVVEKDLVVIDFLKEIFNYMVSRNYPAMTIEKKELKSFKKQIKGTYLH